MKKAVITILGTVGGYCDKENNKKGIYSPKEKATYRSDIEEISEKKSINSFPILIEFYSKEYEIVPIYTPCAKDIQQEVISQEGLKCDFDPLYEIEDDMDFDTVFGKIDEVISSYDKVIIDVSHGYRHLPILMIINAVMHNIESIEKIEKILFAKEIEQFKEYRFVDLKRYLDLANISYALTTFDRNYTVANNVKVSDKRLNDFLNTLSTFSQHILANSIDELLLDTNENKSIASQLISEIGRLMESDEIVFQNLKRLLEKTLHHLENISSYKDKEEHQKLYYLSKNMYEKGYLLNSITLLSEAIGVYAMLQLKNIDNSVAEFIDEFEEKAKNEKNNENRFFEIYALYNQSKAFYNNQERYYGNFLEIKKKYSKNNPKTSQKISKWNEKTKVITNIIKKSICNIVDPKVVDLNRTIDNIRNNLAHANSSKRLREVKFDINNTLNKFYDYCIKKDDGLEIKPNSASAGKKSDTKGSTPSNLDTSSELKTMPNGEVRKVKKLKKRKPIVQQSEKNKELLKKGASLLAKKFNA